MATSEEKQELVDQLSGPRFYRINLWGYGGEAAYINLNRDQYEFWNEVVEEHGDSDVVNYMVSAEDGEFEFEDITGVPEEADFMKDQDGDYRPWYEHHKEFSHQWGIEYSSATFSIDEVDSAEYGADYISNVLDGTNLDDYIQNIMEESDYEAELLDSGPEEEYGDEYVLQFYSAEKGTFFDGVIETTGDFDPKKLKVYTSEFPNGEDIITSIEYDGVDIDNQGGDTNGKGYSVHVWTNE